MWQTFFENNSGPMLVTAEATVIYLRLIMKVDQVKRRALLDTE